MRVAVIMAGGVGERFWPLSRKNRPKQFLALTGARPMLAETVARAQSVPAVREVYVVAGPHLKEGICAILPDLPEENVLIEPLGKNTAPCLAFAAAVIAKKHGPETVMGVMTADSRVEDAEAFRRTVDLAFDFAEQNDTLVTIAVPPTHPDTGFGYLELGASASSDARGAVRRVLSFREKPDPATARQYVESGNFSWNSGMFFWKCSVLLNAFEQWHPELARGAREIAAAFGSGAYPGVLKTVFDAWPFISIDYAVMEKALNVCAVVGDFGWDDVGTWNALARTQAQDAAGNLRAGRSLVFDTRNTIIYNPGEAIPPGGSGGEGGKQPDEPLVVTLGVENLVIVVSKGATLVCHRDRVQDIKQVLQGLRDEGLENLL